jgi:hypothetical protein
MQKVLIVTVGSIWYNNKPFVDLLSKILGETPKHWDEYISDCTAETIKELRMNPVIHKAIEDANFTLTGVYPYEYQWGDKLYKDESEETMEFKIIEIPDNVDWDIVEYDCGDCEYVVEKHRVWY